MVNCARIATMCEKCVHLPKTGPEKFWNPTMGPSGGPKVENSARPIVTGSGPLRKVPDSMTTFEPASRGEGAGANITELPKPGKPGGGKGPLVENIPMPTSTGPVATTNGAGWASSNKPSYATVKRPHATRWTTRLRRHPPRSKRKRSARITAAGESSIHGYQS